MRSYVIAISGFLALGFSGAASAEVARMRGDFPAQNRQASYLQRLAVDRIDGRDGGQMEFAVEQALGKGGYFTLVAGPGARPDGVVSGAVDTSVEQNDYTNEVKRCAEKQNDKCVREDRVKVPCTRRVIAVTANIRIARTNDGLVVFSSSNPLRDEVSWCKDDRLPRPVQDAVTSMVAAAAQSVAGQITPHTDNYQIRFRESRDGMPKDIGARFKEAIKLSQRDLPSACAAWTQMDGQMPNNPSVVFDLALCAEAAGKYDAALSLYTRAEGLIGGRGSNEGTEGANRVRQLIAGREDAQRRAGRRS